MSLTEGQILYIHKLLESYYDAHSPKQKQDVIQAILKEHLPHHGPAKGKANPEQLNRLQGILLIRIIKTEHCIPMIPFRKLDRLWFDMHVIQRYPHFTHCLQIFHDKKRPPMHITILPHIMMLDFDDQNPAPPTPPHSNSTSPHAIPMPMPMPMPKALIEKLQSTGDRFHVYKTSKGWHAYCVNRFIEKRNMDVMRYMEALGCDPLYIAFAYRFGFMSRLSPKYPQDPVETWVGEVAPPIPFAPPAIPDILETLKMRCAIVRVLTATDR